MRTVLKSASTFLSATSLAATILTAISAAAGAGPIPEPLPPTIMQDCQLTRYQEDPPKWACIGNDDCPEGTYCWKQADGTCKCQ